MKPEKLEEWGRTHNLKKLHRALKADNFKIRIEAIKEVKKIGDKESVEHLVGLIDDNFLTVVNSALEAVKSISPNHSKIPDFEKRVEKLTNYNINRSLKTSESFEPIDEEEEREKLKKMSKDYDIMKVYQKGLKEERKQIFNWRLAITILGIAALILAFLKYFVFF